MTEKSIFESENLFKELFDNMSSGVAIYEVFNDGEDFIFKEFNNAGEKINNIKRDDIIGKKLTEIFPGVKEFGLFEVFQRVWKTGNAELHPTNMYKDERITLWVQNYVFKLPSGNIVAICTDVTEKRIAEEKLQHSELDLKFKNLFYNSPLGIELYDSEGKLIDANKACLDMFGVKEVSLVKGFNLFEDPNLSDDTQEKLSKGESVQFETEFDFEKVKEFELYETSKSGRIFIDTLITPLYLKGGKQAPNYLVYVQDITNKYLTARELNIRNQISKIFLTVTDDEMYGEVLDIILKVLNSKYGVFGYINEKEEIVCASMTKHIWDICVMDDKTIIFPRDQWGGIWGNSVIEKRTIYSNEPFKVPEGHVLVENALSVPFLYQDICLGHILVANREGGYQKEDIKLLESIVDWIAPILHARLNRDIQEKKREEAEENLKKLNEELEHRVKERTHELKESEEKFRNITEQSLMGIMIKQDGEIKYVNEAFEKINEYTAQEMLKWSENGFINIVHPDDVEFVIEQAKKKQSGSQDIVIHYQSRIISKSGKTKWVEVFSKTIIYNGRFADFITVIDITENKLAEQKLTESEEKYRNLFQQYKMLVESITDSVYVLDKDWNYILVNETAAKLVQLTVDEILNHNLLDLFPSIEETPFFKVYNSVMETKNMDRILNEFTHPDGRYGVYEVSVYPITEGILCIARDITEEKEIERKLKKSEEKYRKAYYQANLYRDVFAHDLNNILQNINSSAELSSLYLNNPEKLHTVKELYEITNEQVKRGQKLIANVRKITEIDESEIQLEKINIRKPLEKAIEILKTSYQTRKISVQVNDNAKKQNVKANSLLLEVFENLLMNAVEHNENPIIEIFINITMEGIEKGNFIKMEFKDNGIGISDYRKKSIFEKGIRKDQRSKGMGLGLSLVKKIIDRYNGKIWVENKVKGDSSKGSNFIVLIPAA